jgi:hypothetical protein
MKMIGVGVGVRVEIETEDVAFSLLSEKVI